MRLPPLAPRRNWQRSKALEAEIAAAAGGNGTTLIVAPWSADGHTDHDAAGAAAARAAQATRSMFLEYPIWIVALGLARQRRQTGAGPGSLARTAQAGAGCD